MGVEEIFWEEGKGPRIEQYSWRKQGVNNRDEVRGMEWEGWGGGGRRDEVEENH